MWVNILDLFVYSDESGVFDYVHNQYFTYGGLIFFGKEQKDVFTRKYIAAERTIADTKQYQPGAELKASYISNKHKGKLFRSLNQCYKFGVVINQKQILKEIYSDKKSKQRYLDYAYKIGLKRLLEHLFRQDVLDKDSVQTIHIYADEHTTATDGRYELKEALLKEFKAGTFNPSYSCFSHR